MATNGAV